MESVTLQWSRSWVCNRTNHLWYKALELGLTEEDLVWLALPCTTTHLVSVLTQRIHNPLYVTGTKSCKWTGHSTWITNITLSNLQYSSTFTEKCYSTLFRALIVLKEDNNNKNQRIVKQGYYRQITAGILFCYLLAGRLVYCRSSMERL